MSFRLGDCLLLERLNEKGWTQAEFAKRMGVTRQYVSKLVSGDRKMSLEFAINAANILGCRVTDLYILNVVRKRN
ncbi:helix-turn-helix transcriptional regulator [Paenibacillus sp. Marseille-Q4541]|uniref:helix-turn-helix transcriptional regulator n=1 Tax=Paenibacillus sp. Marseille-Q4541 TaxID=2831522 RepID=UPI001BA91654|nr:helix-turn-helix transcriptional regulator [Paenibacillus sp. Marseille-Q4541]